MASGDDDLSTFLEGLRNAGLTAFSSRITVSDDYRGFRCEVEIGEGGSGWGGPAPFFEHYNTQAAALHVMRTMIERACPAWKYAEFFLDCSYTNHRSSGYSTWVSDMVPLLRSSPSLSTICLDGCSFGLHLPTLVCDNPFLETLILSLKPYFAPYPPTNELEYARRLALSFSRNSALKSCTLGATFSTVQTWEVALKPFMPSSEGQANVTLKELVLVYGEDLATVEAAANLVRWNTTLEKLELCSFRVPPEGVSWIPQALAVNRTLNEFRWKCDPAGLKELAAGAFRPDSSGRQGNACMTTLKLFPDGKLSEFMKELCRLLEINTTLKHVEVDLAHVKRAQEEPYWEVRSSNAPPSGSKECVQDMVESILIGKELKANTSLESVVVGSWKLLRVGGHGEWQMKYCGPCLIRRSPLAGETQDHLEKHASLCYVLSRYDVKVKMHQ